MNRRLIGLLGAILLAGAATFLLFQYVDSADERARQDEALSEVFVAQGDITPGISADDAIAQGLIDRGTVPARSVPAGAIANLDQITGQIATVPLYEGEVIVSQRFGTTVAQGTDGLAEIPEGLQAVTVEANVLAGVAGFVQPQDTVSVLASLTIPEEGEDGADPDGTDEADTAAEGEPGATGFRTQYLVQNAVVLAVGQRVVATGQEGEQEPGIRLSNDRYIFTLGMTPEDIERIVFASQQGQLWFTLLPDVEDGEEREIVDTLGRTVENAFE